MEKEIDIVGKTSLYKIFTPRLIELISAVPQELWDIDESEAFVHARPTTTQMALKKKLWKAIDECEPSGKVIDVKSVYSGICSAPAFYKFFSVPYKAVWFLKPYKEYTDHVTGLVDLARERYLDLLSMDITVPRRIKNKDGEMETVRVVCPKTAFVLLNTIKQLEDRVHGKPIEKQINVHTSDKDSKIDAFDINKINERLREVEGLLGGQGGENDVEKRVSYQAKGYIEAEITGTTEQSENDS